MPGENMKQKARRLVGLVARVVLITTLMGSGVLTDGRPILAQAANVTVTITAPDTVMPGSDFMATVNISRVENFDACNYDVSFNPTVLRLNNVTSGNIGGTAIPVGIWNETSPGTFTIVQNVPGFSGVSGSGYLAVLHFQIIGSDNTTSQIALSNEILGNNLGLEIPAVWTGVLVQITTEPTGQGTPPTPANFFTSDVSVTPREVLPAEPVTISVLVTNSGGSEGSYTVTLQVNGVKEAEKEVILGGRQIRTVSFTTVKNTASTYIVDVNGKLGEFTVTASPPEPPAGGSAPPPTATATITPPLPEAGTTGTSEEKPSSPTPPVSEEVVTEESLTTAALSPEPETTDASDIAPAPPPPPPAAQTASADWPVLWGIIGGVVIVIGLIIFFQVRGRLY